MQSVQILPHEEKALDFASTCAGEYLAEINKTDLATFTAEEWHTLLSIIAGNFCDKAQVVRLPF